MPSLYGELRRRLWLAALTLFVSANVVAADLPPIADPEVRACVDRTIATQSLTQHIALSTFDDSGLIEKSVADMYFQYLDGGGSRAVVRLSEPPSRAGLAVLMIESDADEPVMYLYVPDLNRTRRVTGKQLASSMLGTDFSYEEFAHFQRTASQSDTQRIEDAAVDGVAVYVLETRPGGADSPYARILTFVDKARCVPLETRFMDASDTVVKELVAAPDAIRTVGERYVPHLVTMFDRQKRTRTELTIENLQLDVDLADSIFSPKRLGMAP